MNAPARIHPEESGSVLTGRKHLARLELVSSRIADELDWRRHRNVAALLASMRAYPPKTRFDRASYAQTTDERQYYVGWRADTLRKLHAEAVRRAMLASDKGDERPAKALWNCDPAKRDVKLPIAIRNSSPVDRIIYDAIQGEVA